MSYFLEDSRGWYKRVISTRRGAPLGKNDVPYNMTNKAKIGGN